MINRKTIPTLSAVLAAVVLLFTGCPNDTLPDTYTITYNANGGSGSIASVTVAEGSTISLSTNSFIRNNCSFAGWSTTSGGSVEYSEGASFTMGSSDVVLYAQWSAVDYTSLFTDASAGLTGVYRSSSSFADVDNDGDLDLLITGDKDGGGDSSSILYINDGAGNFTDDTSAGLQDVYDGFTSFADVDNDGDQDLLITGFTGYIDERTATLYTNNGTGKFTDVSAGLTGVGDGSSCFADVDNDGYLDLLITGYTSDNGYIATLYINDGDRNFADASAGLTAVGFSSSSFADVDGDGDPDLLITGHTGSSRTTTLYTNNGAGKFTDASAGLTGVCDGSSSFADVDNDGDPDLLITGYTGSSRTTALYINDGAGSFTDASADLTGVRYGSSSFADVDGDGDQDLLITGKNGSSRTTILYTNDGAGNFTDANAGLTGVEDGSVSFADVDDDGDLDLLITGYGTATLYLNGLY